MKISSANRIAPDGTTQFAASHLGSFCLLLSHKRDARLIWVKSKVVVFQHCLVGNPGDFKCL